MVGGYLNEVTVVAIVVVAMVVVAIFVGFIGLKMGANGGRAQMGVDTIIHGSVPSGNLAQKISRLRSARRATY